MHIRRNCHRYIWILSGTSDGPPIVKGLIAKDYEVSVSVVTAQGALPYSQMPLHHLWIGSLDGANGIREVLENAYKLHGGYNFVIDATHPFAQEISFNLKKVCQEFDQPLIRFERHCKTIPNAVLIKNIEELLNFNLNGKKVLFALGARVLPKAIECLKDSGAVFFARVLPTPQGLLAVLASDLSQDNFAVVRPSKEGRIIELEAALCRKWGITSVVARQSGGPTQSLWQNIAELQNLDLWLISRPLYKGYSHIIHTNSELLKYF